MMNKRALVIRFGAIGDSIITTPLIKYLKLQGWEVYVNTSEIGMEVYKNNPYIDKFIYYKSESLSTEQLHDYWKGIKEKENITRIFNLTESIEVSLALHPAHPNYNYTKQERYKLCNKNYYEYTFQHLGLNGNVASMEGIDLVGDLHFTQEEYDYIENELKPYKNYFKIYLPISGSGVNKLYPYWQPIFDKIYKHYNNIKLFTVGDMTCELIEYGWGKKYLIPKSSKWSIRQSMLAPKYMNLVVSPDTGIMHAAGTFTTPKIIVFGHNTPENISKHFRGHTTNICSTVNCAPCFRLIYDSQIQCPRYEPLGVGCLCMTGLWEYRVRNNKVDPGKFISGINPSLVEQAILSEYDKWKFKHEHN